MTRVGFVVGGVVGAPPARNTPKGGFPLAVYDVDAAATERLVQAGAAAAESPAAVANVSDVVMITMVPDAPDVEQAALGPRGILAGAHRGLIYIDMSTIHCDSAPLYGHALSEHRLGQALREVPEIAPGPRRHTSTSPRALRRPGPSKPSANGTTCRSRRRSSLPWPMPRWRASSPGPAPVPRSRTRPGCAASPSRAGSGKSSRP
jgi:NAD binding domain of 6-phosphogluconate dehydrogenase